ncbi:MAG: hypothetical protein U9R16_08650 [Campylobacterota bacterium]|nr:hypothetical protein [Campylobacterota bacterium]
MRDVKLYYIDRIIGDAGFGASAPIIVYANKKKYILKTKKDNMQDDSFGIFNELLAYQLISYLKYKISPQEVAYLYIDDKFIEDARIAYMGKNIKKESYDNIVQSKGVNLGIEFLENTMQPSGEIQNKSFIKDIAHIDNYIMNCDRSANNINILQDTTKYKKYYAIDFGNALADGINGELYQNIKDNTLDELLIGQATNCNVTLSGNYSLKNDVQKIIKQNRRIKDDYITIRNILKLIIEEFPTEWEPVKYKNDIIDILARRMKNKNIFNLSEKCSCIY